MLFFEHHGVLIYSKENYHGLALNNDNLQKGVNTMDLLCLFLNLGIDSETFIKSYVTLLRRKDDDYYDAAKELGISFDGTMEDRVSNALLFSATSYFGLFSGSVISSYLINFLNVHETISKSFAECTTIDEGTEYFVSIEQAIIEALNKIVFWANRLFSSDNPHIDAQEIFEQQNIKYKIIPFENGYVSLYEIDNFDVLSLLLFLYLEYLKLGKNLCECKNCKRTFMPTLRKEEVYCTHVNENGKTCKENGYENTLDKIDKAYRKAYKTKNAFKNRNIANRPNIEKQFTNWISTAQEMKQRVKNGDITESEYYTFLNISLGDMQ